MIYRKYQPPIEQEYGKYLPYLEKEFLYSCAYCTITQAEAKGISFEIDHYLAEADAPELASEYENLLYSCKKCNSTKRRWPSGYDQSLGHVVLRPDRDRFSCHFDVESLAERFEWAHLTNEGAFHIRLFRLNFSRFKKLRMRRAEMMDLSAESSRGIAWLDSFHFDRLARGDRPAFLRLRQKIRDKHGLIEAQVDQWIADNCKSDQLETDDSDHDLLRDHKAFLRKCRKAAKSE